MKINQKENENREENENKLSPPFSILIKDVKYKFEIWTNYKNLEYFIKVQKLNQKQAY